MSIKPSASRMIALQIVLTLTIISNIIGAANAIRNFDAFLLANPKLNNVLGYVYVMSALIAVIGAYYLWSLKNSGLYVITIAFIAVIGLDLYAGISPQQILASSPVSVLFRSPLTPLRKSLN